MAERNIVQLITDPNIDSKLIRSMVLQIAEDVNQRHSEGSTHSYIKLQNILIDGDTITITYDTVYADYKQSHYYPFDRIERKLDFADDVWALGILIFEIVIGIRMDRMLTKKSIGEA